MRVIALLFFLLITIASHTQVSHFDFSKEEWPEKTVLHYKKTNWDGSNEGFISIYFKDGDWLESIKWHEGSNQVSIIPAKIDHSTFSVHHFKNIRCENGDCNQLGEMVKDPETGDYIINFGAFKDSISHVPAYWHSYDFDWASLMAAFLFKKTHTSHQFQRYDFFMKNGQPGFGYLGDVQMEYKGKYLKNNKLSHVYSIDGSGLSHQGGEIWFSEKESVLMGFKIKTPDESSYQDVDFKWLSMETMELSEWEAFKESKWAKK